MVPFAALGRDAVRSIVERELDQLAQRDGIKQREVQLDVAAAAGDWLARVGFDPDLGARPLQRAIDQQVLAPLADALNGYGAEVPLAARVDVADETIRVQVRGRDATDAFAKADRARAALTQVVASRRQAQRLVTCSAALGVENEAERLRRERAQRLKKKRADAWSDPQMHELPGLEALSRRVREGLHGLEAAEDALAVAYHGGDRSAAADPEPDPDPGVAARAAFREVLLDLYGRQFAVGDDLLLAVYGAHATLVLPLVSAYRAIAAAHGASVGGAPLFVWTVGKETPPADGAAVRLFGAPDGTLLPAKRTDGEQVVWRGAETPMPAAVKGMPRADVFGWLLRFRGRHVGSLLGGEAGRHVFRGRRGARTCWVDPARGSWAAFAPPVGVETCLSGGRFGQPELGEAALLRRTYDAASQTLEDKRLDRRTGWSLERTEPVLSALVHDAREQALEEMLRS